ncbi:MAG: nucleotidyltransferase [Bacteroidales bacterium]
MKELGRLYYNVLQALNQYNVKYLIVGGFATNFHGVIRSTIDLDLWVDKKGNNPEKLFHAFISMGYNQSSCKEAITALDKDHLIKIPLDHDLVEIMDDYIIRMDFDQAYVNRVERNMDDITIHVIGLNDLIAIKTKSNRYQDLDDARKLKEYRDQEED